MQLSSLKEQTQKLARALEVGGLMNVQYALKGGEIYVLEVNPRASRTVPFVAKVIGKPIAAIAARVMAGEPLASFDLKLEKLDHVGVKEAVFPFARFPGVDTVLGPEMRSTGEVMGIDRSFEVAFAKSQLGAGSRPPTSGAVFVSVRDADKERSSSPRATAGARVQDRGHRRHPALPDRSGPQGERSTKSPRAAPMRRTRCATAPCSSCSTPPKGRPRCRIQAVAARRPLAKNALLHHNFRSHRGGRRDPRRCGRRTRSQGVAGLSGVTAR